MSTNWKIDTLQNLCEVFVDGDWVETKDQSSEGIRLVQTGNIGFGFFKDKEDKARFISESTFKRLNCTEVLPGDLLVSRLPDPVGKSCLIPELNTKMITGVDCTIIRPKKIVLSEYLCYFQQSEQYLQTVKQNISGTTRDRISRKNLGSIPVPYPPLKEQKQIVAILDEVFEALDRAKANINKNIKNTNELFQVKLNAVFSNNSWEEKKLKDVSLVFGRGKSKHRPRNDKSLYGGEYPFVQTGDVRNSKKLILEYTQTYNEVGLKQSKLWPEGTICITIAANIAETAILTFDACFPDSMIGLVVDPKKADKNFTYYALQYLKSKLQLMGKGSAQDNINLGTFEIQKFPFPSLVIQKQTAKELDELLNRTEELLDKYSKRINALEELKKSILQKAFVGELIKIIA